MDACGLVKVTDAATGKLKRWETPNGKPVAVIDNCSLALTKLGKQLGYKVNGCMGEEITVKRVICSLQKAAGYR